LTFIVTSARPSDGTAPGADYGRAPRRPRSRHRTRLPTLAARRHDDVGPPRRHRPGRAPPGPRLGAVTVTAADSGARRPVELLIE